MAKTCDNTSDCDQFGLVGLTVIRDLNGTLVGINSSTTDANVFTLPLVGSTVPLFISAPGDPIYQATCYEATLTAYMVPYPLSYGGVAENICLEDSYAGYYKCGEITIGVPQIGQLTPWTLTLPDNFITESEGHIKIVVHSVYVGQKISPVEERKYCWPQDEQACTNFEILLRNTTTKVNAQKVVLNNIPADVTAISSVESNNSPKIPTTGTLRLSWGIIDSEGDEALAFGVKLIDSLGTVIYTTMSNPTTGPMVKIGGLVAGSRSHTFNYAGLLPNANYRVVVTTWDAANSYFPINPAQSLENERWYYTNGHTSTFTYNVTTGDDSNLLPTISSMMLQGSDVNLFAALTPLDVLANQVSSDPYVFTLSATDSESDSLVYGLSIYDREPSSPLYEVTSQAGNVFNVVLPSLDTSKVYTVVSSVRDAGNPLAVYAQRAGYIQFNYPDPDITDLTVNDGSLIVLPQEQSDPDVFVNSNVFTISTSVEKVVQDSLLRLKFFTGDSLESFFEKDIVLSGFGPQTVDFIYNSVDAVVSGTLFKKISNNTEIRIESTIYNVISGNLVQDITRTGWFTYRLGDFAMFIINEQLVESELINGRLPHHSSIKVREFGGANRDLANYFIGSPNTRIDWRLKKPTYSTPALESEHRNLKNVSVFDSNSDTVNLSVNPLAQDYLNAYDTKRIVEWIVYEGGSNDPYDPSSIIIDSGSVVVSNTYPPTGVQNLVGTFIGAGTGDGSTTPVQVRIQFKYADADADDPVAVDIQVRDASTPETDPPSYQERVQISQLVATGSSNYEYIVPHIFNVASGAVYSVTISVTDGELVDPDLVQFSGDLDFSGPLYQIIDDESVLIEFTDQSPASPQRIASFANVSFAFPYSNPILSDLEVDGNEADFMDCALSADGNCNLTSLRPLFTWTYSDSNVPVQTQTRYFVEIAKDSAFTDLVISQQVNSSIAEFQTPNDLMQRSNLYFRVYATNSSGRNSAIVGCTFRINGDVPTYEIVASPVGSTSHTATLFAKNKIGVGLYIDPPTDSVITWLKDGEVIKTGSTGVPTNLFVSNFSASDTGTPITFEVEDPEFGTLNANTVLLTNQRMGNTITETELSFVTSVPDGSSIRLPASNDDLLATWTFNDPDDDLQYGFRLKFFTFGNEANPLFDTGYIYYAKPADINEDNTVTAADITEFENRQDAERGDPEYLEACDLNRDGVIDEKDLTAAKLFLGSTYPASGPIQYRIRFKPNLPQGGVVYYKFETSDGEKVNPLVDDYPEIPGRVFVASTSAAIQVNNRPVASNLRLSGMPVGANCYVIKSQPVISWNYSDADGDIQLAYELVVSTSMSIDDISAQVWNTTLGSNATSVVYGGLPLVDGTPYYVFLRVHDGVENSQRLSGLFTKIPQIYSVFPVNPYHTSKLEARATNATQFPYFEGGHTIEWYVDGQIVKSGNTSSLFDLYINSKQPNDFNLTAENTGSVVYYRIDNTNDSAVVNISNHRPEISYSTVTPIIPGFRPRVSRTPVIGWEFADTDNDSQLFFRVIVGTTQGSDDIYDSGPIFGNPGDINGDQIVDQNDVVIVQNLLGTTFADSQYLLAADCNRDGTIDEDDLVIVNQYLGKTYIGNPNIHSHTIPLSLDAGLTYYYTISVSDGEQTELNLPNSPDPYWSNKRILVSSQGSFTTNAKPEVRNVLIDGLPVNEAYNNKKPTFSWEYFDDEYHVESHYRFRLYSDPGMTNILWDTGNISSSGNSVKYSYNGTGPELSYFSTYYFSIIVNDGIDDSETYAGQVLLKKLGPIITICTVNDVVNPLNVRGQLPVFTWDIDEEDEQVAVVAFEIRAGIEDESLGTDSFVGDIWNSGVTVSDNPFRAIWNFNGTCFSGCASDKELVPSVTYYYQVRVYDELGQPSNWCYGYFRLNNVPTAIDLQVLPLAPSNSDDIEGYYRFVDDVGEKESNLTELKWFRTRNGTVSEIAEVRNTKLVSSSYTANGDIWYFTVKPHDGTEFGELVRSPQVQVENKPPTITALPIQPESPTASSELRATWLTSDPDGDEVTVTVEWYKNGIGQADLRNSELVPAGYLKAGDEWYYVVQPYDGTEYGMFSKSNIVTIEHTKPEILSMTVDGDILPLAIKSKSPVVAWRYLDIDQTPQAAYRLILGTRPIKTTGRLSETTPPPFGSRDNGILYTYPDGDIISGNEVFDTGETTASESSYTYKNGDPLEPVLLGVPQASRLLNYVVGQDLATLVLSPARTNGEVTFDFNGKTGTYEIALEYIQETKKAKFRLSIDGLEHEEFTSDNNGSGAKIKKFAPAKINAGSKITITGIALEAGSSAKFKRVIFVPSTKLEIIPTSMDLSGYTLQGDNTIKLSALSGTATIAFPFPSGQYDIELQYITELSGNPILTMDVGDSRIINFVFESGIQTRARRVQNVTIATGDVLKITGTKSSGATARVVKIVARPRQQSTSGYILRPGIPYYASVKVYDGHVWSDWYTTKFFLEGSPWGDNVSNTNGWTIESRFRIIP